MADRKSRAIPAAKANKEIGQRKNLVKDLARITDTLSIVTGVEKSTVDKFFGSAGNGFLFSRESVLRHFFKDPIAIDASLFNENTDLLTILAAHDVTEVIDTSEFEKGNPTVIIAGVKEDSTGLTEEEISNNIQKFLFKTSGDPADEYPPIQTIDEIRKFVNSNAIFIQFSVK